LSTAPPTLSHAHRPTAHQAGRIGLALCPKGDVMQARRLHKTAGKRRISVSANLL
jgi:hypothetical protein